MSIHTITGIIAIEKLIFARQVGYLPSLGPWFVSVKACW